MWIIQSNFVREDQTRPLVEALNEYGIPFQDVCIIPFSDEFVTPLEHDKKDLIPYGSTSLMRIAAQRGWTGLFFDPERFNVIQWNRWRNDMLNQDIAVMPAKLALKFFEKMDESEWFIRPVHDLKAFNGSVSTAADISTWMRNVDSVKFTWETPVVIAEPQVIDSEYRFFIVGREVVTGSSYRLKGLKLVQRVTDPEILEDAKQLARGWLPHETCVMDMAYVPGKKRPKVIEFNCLNASGFYYHDIRAFAHAVTQYFITR